MKLCPPYTNAHNSGEKMRTIKVMVFLAVMAGLVFPGPGKVMLGTALAAPETKCPVYGGDIDKKVYTDYKGQRIYFCCSACIEIFNKDPEKYLKKMQAEGVTPEKTPSK
jgi:YHS domain-containing protein